MDDYGSQYLPQGSRGIGARTYLRTGEPYVGRANQLRVVDTVREDVKLLGWDHFHDSRVHTLIHVDSITSRVMLVPHFDRSKKDSQMCVIPMWKAR